MQGTRISNSTYKTSNFQFRVCFLEVEEFAALAMAAITLPSCSLRVRPSLSSSGLLSQGLVLQSLPATVKRTRGVVAQLPSYGIPSYGAPRPYQTPGADFHNGARPAETIANPGFGDKTRPGFEWNYRCPADYSTPVSYQTPQGYGSPRAYSPDAGGNDGDGGSGGDDGGRGDGGESHGDGEGEDAAKQVAGLSMSQKLTLAYAVLVGVGGIMGFAKTGSSKSLMAGGGSALILYYVFQNLPTKPIMSSIIGLGISGLLLFVMGSRYSETGKVFPAGVVSLYSLVMTGGYIHGIMRGH